MVSLLIFLAFLAVWYSATLSSTTGASSGTAGLTAEQVEYQKMMGKDPGNTKSTGFPSPGQMGATVVKQLSNPFYDNGPNDKGGGGGGGFRAGSAGGHSAGLCDRHVAAAAPGL